MKTVQITVHTTTNKNSTNNWYLHQQMETVVFIVIISMVIACCDTQCPAPDCKEDFLVDELPNPRKYSGHCGRFCKDSWICDPCNILDNETADAIDTQLGVVTGHGADCSSGKTYYIAVAIVPKIKHYTDKHDIELFTRALIDKWGLQTDGCGNGISIVISRDDRQVYTYAGRTASESLEPPCIADIYEEAKAELTEGRYGAGLRIMITKYREILDKGQCATYDDSPGDPIWIIILSLGLFAAIFICICAGFIYMCKIAQVSSGGGGHSTGYGGVGGGGGNGVGGGGGDCGGGGGGGDGGGGGGGF